MTKTKYSFIKLKLQHVITVLLLSPPTLLACDCPSIPALNKEIINQNYTTIFQGTIDSIVIKNEKAIAHFQVHDLFKGKITETIMVAYQHVSDCQINMNTGDTWIIYAITKNYNTLIVDACSRSRKQFAKQSDDYYAMSNLTSYQDELAYLKEHFGIKPIVKNVEHTQDAHQLIHPNGQTKIILLFFSIAGFSLIYWAFKRYVK